MDVADFLAENRIGMDVLVDAVRATVGLDPTDCLLAVGSLAEGLGNSKSDVDLLLLRDDANQANRGSSFAIVVGRHVFDIRILPLKSLDRLTQQLDLWVEEPWQSSVLVPFSHDDRQLLHRVLCSQTIFKGEAAINVDQGIDRVHLSKLKLQVARHVGRTIQVDISGYMEQADFASSVFAAQELLGHAIDALAAGHFLTNVTPKWRSRILAGLPANWENSLCQKPSNLGAQELFWTLHRAPQKPNLESSKQHLLPISNFARAVFAWAEVKLLEDDSAMPIPLSWRETEATSDLNLLPSLEADVDFAKSEGGYELARINEFGKPLTLTTSEFRLALLFDGRTTASEAELACSRDQHDGESTRDLAQKLSMAGLLVSSPQGSW